MKKTLKNCLYSITIIFFILIIGTAVYEYNIYKNEIQKLDLPIVKKDSTFHNETIRFQDGMSLLKKDKLTYFNGRIGLIWRIAEITIISLVLGTTLGLVISVKEYSKSKYFLYFILGNIFYNFLTTIIIQIIYPNNTISLLAIFIRSECKTFILYSFVYLLFIGIKYIDNKKKVQTLNKNLIFNRNANKNQ